MKLNGFKFSNHQNGAALFVSLIILTVLTILSLAGMRSTIMEEKMSANIRDRNTAFQAAEIAMTFAENDALNTWNTVADFDGSNAGLIDITATEPDYYDSATTWDKGVANTISRPLPAASEVAVGSNGTNAVTVAPRYILQHIRTWDPNKSDTFGSSSDYEYGESDTSRQISLLKITSNSTGITPSSSVTLQSYYFRPGLN